MQLYRYALDLTDQVVDVLDLPTERDNRGGPYTCLSCGQPLIAKTAARKRDKHFAHKTTQLFCSNETYLHKLAKHTFYETFLRCREQSVPYLVELPHRIQCSVSEADVCPDWARFAFHDLTRNYDTARLERRDGQFIPDLLLTDSSGVSPKLYVEILVSHPVSEAKAASGAAVIEIAVESETCVETIRSAKLPHAMLNLYNVVPPLINNPQLSCQCDQHPKRIANLAIKRRNTYPPLKIATDDKSVREAIRSVQFCLAFSVPANLVPRLIVGFRGELEGALSNAVFSCTESFSDLTPRGPWQMPLTCLNKMEAKGIKAQPHCFVCRHVQMHRERRHIGHSVHLHCPIYKKMCDGNTALRCPSFVPANQADKEQANPQNALPFD